MRDERVLYRYYIISIFPLSYLDGNTQIKVITPISLWRKLLRTWAFAKQNEKMITFLLKKWPIIPKLFQNRNNSLTKARLKISH